MGILKLIFCLRNKMFDYSILLCLLLFIIKRAYGGATNETSNPVALRSGPILQEFGDDVPRAAAQISIRDCLCQCHWQTFRDRYGKTHGNCKSTHNGAQWCYVRTPVQTYLGYHGHTKLVSLLTSLQTFAVTCYKIIEKQIMMEII